MTDPQHTDAQQRDTHHKALAINLDPSIYGTLAEIGAGQEVARWFLQVGGASGTVAKTISAYDMTFSDETYGKVGRYVSRERVAGMLDREYALLTGLLGAQRGGAAKFFVLADTVSARNFAGTNECHGWVGLRFQATPGAEPNDIILHVNLMDPTNLLQQQAVGILGVNLIYAAYHQRTGLSTLLAGLFDELSASRIEIDLLELRGPEFATVDGRTVLLDLIAGGFAEAVLFPADGPPRPPSEQLRKRPLVFASGVFGQIMPVHRQMLAAGVREIAAEYATLDREPLPLFALTTRRPAETESTPPADLLARVDALLRLGSGVLVLAHPEAYRLIGYAMRYTREPIRLVTGVSTLAQILLERHDQHLDGQLLEALAKLFAFNMRLYVYPMTVSDFRTATQGTPAVSWIDPAQAVINAQSLRPSAPISHLYAYLTETGFLRPITA